MGCGRMDNIGHDGNDNEAGFLLRQSPDYGIFGAPDLELKAYNTDRAEGKELCRRNSPRTSGVVM